MKIHANAPLGPKGRATMVKRVLEEGVALTEAAEAAGVSARTARKWVGRYRAEGGAGLVDRSSAPRRVHNTTPPERVEAIAALRRLRMTGPEIAETLEMATSTVSAVLKRIGLGKLSRLDAEEPIRRYERRRAGELIHIDVKKLGRIGSHGAGHRVLGRSWAKRAVRQTDAAGVRRLQTGWDRVHVCVDDATRLAYAEVLPDEKAKTVIGFLRRAIAFYRSHGITVEGLMTDNGPAYCSAAHSLACRAMGIKHIRTRAYRPRPTARPSASSARCSESGPTPPSTAPRPRGPLPSRVGSSATTTDDDTAPSATGRRFSGYGSSPGPTWLASTTSARNGGDAKGLPAMPARLPATSAFGRSRHIMSV
jgi:transposase